MEELLENKTVVAHRKVPCTVTGATFHNGWLRAGVLLAEDQVIVFLYRQPTVAYLFNCLKTNKLFYL